MARMKWAQAPWSVDKWGQNFQDITKTRLQSGKRLNKRIMADMGLGYSLGRGYYNAEQDKWQGQSGPVNPFMKEMTLPNGKKVKVIDNNTGDFLGFSRQDDASVADLIQKYMFDKDRKVYVQEGVGHIKELRYSQAAQILTVEFGNREGKSDIVAYLPCPAILAGKLFALAQSGATRDDGRHMLGIEFWNEVRIRGQHTGGRIPYQYVQEGTGSTLIYKQDNDPNYDLNWNGRYGNTYMKPIKNTMDRAAKADQAMMEAEAEMVGKNDPEGYQAVLSEQGVINITDKMELKKRYKATDARYKRRYWDQITKLDQRRVQALEDQGRWEDLFHYWESIFTLKEAKNAENPLTQAEREKYEKKLIDEAASRDEKAAHHLQGRGRPKKYTDDYYAKELNRLSDTYKDERVQFTTEQSERIGSGVKYVGMSGNPDLEYERGHVYELGNRKPPADNSEASTREYVKPEKAVYLNFEEGESLEDAMMHAEQQEKKKNNGRMEDLL